MMQRKEFPLKQTRLSTFIPLFAISMALALSMGCGRNEDVSEPPPPPPVDPEEAPVIRTFNISSYLETCSGETSQLCLVTREGSSEPELIYQDILGFEWNWGYNYVVEVEEIELTPTPADGPGLAYRLVNIVTTSPAPVGSAFEIDMDRKFINPSGRCEFRLMGKAEFKTRSQAVCDQLNLALAVNSVVIGKFSHTGDPESPILLESVRDGLIGGDLTWKKLVYHDGAKPTETGRSETYVCTKTTKFVVKANGTYEFTGCTGFGKGDLSRADLKRIADLAQEISGYDLRYAPTCERNRSERRTYVDLTLSNGDRQRVYRTSGSGEECFKGRVVVADGLRIALRDLADKYIPKPTPTPAPSASPTPTPAGN